MVALDTKYRPSRYSDVIGQDGSVRILREFVRSGAGFHQSYLFCGFHGSGKTTMGRILARALLCDAPPDGEPCDQCASCLSILRTGSSECFVEFDAATNSTKEDVKRLTEMATYDTLSGKRRVYLIDEAHRLSKQALDALLKPMEDTLPGSEDKILVCIFCTTEPERMQKTVYSRCAPAFVIRHVSPAGIAERLASVCQAENIEYDHEALVLIAEAEECHIRDALKAVEGVSMMGRITVEAVREYLRLNANAYLLEVLLNLGRDLPRVLEIATELSQVLSPGVTYERLAEVCILAYRTWLGVQKSASFWPVETLQAIGQYHGDFLLRLGETFSARPAQPTYAMLECDLAQMHHVRSGTWVPAQPLSPAQAADRAWTHRREIAQAPASTPSPDPVPTPVRAPGPEAPSTEEPSASMPSQEVAPTPHAGPVHNDGKVGPGSAATEPAAPYLTPGRVYVDPRSKRKREPSDSQRDGAPLPMDPADFRRLVHRHVAELLDGQRRSA